MDQEGKEAKITATAAIGANFVRHVQGNKPE
jgi:hypothetical protein